MFMVSIGTYSCQCVRWLTPEILQMRWGSRRISHCRRGGCPRPRCFDLSSGAELSLPLAQKVGLLDLSRLLLMCGFQKVNLSAVGLRTPSLLPAASWAASWVYGVQPVWKDPRRSHSYGCMFFVWLLPFLAADKHPNQNFAVTNFIVRVAFAPAPLPISLRHLT